MHGANSTSHKLLGGIIEWVSDDANTSWVHALSYAVLPIAILGLFVSDKRTHMWRYHAMHSVVLNLALMVIAAILSAVPIVRSVALLFWLLPIVWCAREVWLGRIIRLPWVTDWLSEHKWI